MTASLLVALQLAAAPFLSPAEAPRRAVVVGSNAAIEGRAPLRYAHRDAQGLVDVLVTSGGFHARDVVVLLDPRPAEVLEALDAARAAIAAEAAQGLLLFYYSGHADQRALFPGGGELPLTALRARLSDDAAGVRIGIIDACRGGGWTQTKGLTPVAPFEVGLPALASEGTALLAASSGLEDAHETEALQGSFFTHHLVAGLRGAADATADGQVTLSEAFAYANRLTIRDTATRSREPQHPSFDLRLRGRQDVVLTSLGAQATQLVLAQTEGPLEVVQLSTGVTVVEAAPGEQVLRLALPPGPYLVRRLREGQVLSREVTVKANEATRLEESSLTLVGSAAVAGKGPDATREVRGRHELVVGTAVAPFDAFLTNVGVTADYTYFFAGPLGWRVLNVAYLFPLSRGLSDQLTRDFGVLPTAFSVTELTAHTDLVWAPTLLRGGASELRAGLSFGPAMLMTRPWSEADEARVSVRTLRFGIAASAELTWMVGRPGAGPGLGVRLAFSDTVSFIGDGALSLGHTAAFALGVTGTFGAER